MDERLRKRYEVLTSLLKEPKEELDTLEGRASWIDERLASFDEFMEHREFELALDILQDAGGEFECTASFWRKLKRATDVMGLEDRRNYLRSAYGEAKRREGAA